MDDLVRVEVWIPRTRISELYDLASKWTQSTAVLRSATVGGELPRLASPSAEETGTLEVPSLRGWDEGPSQFRIRDAQLLLRLISLNARRIVEFLSEHPGRGFSADEVANALNLPGVSSFTGTLASIGTRSRALRRTTPIRYETRDDGAKYSIEPDVAESFRTAIEGDTQLSDQSQQIREYEKILDDWTGTRHNILERLKQLRENRTPDGDQKTERELALGENELALIDKRIAEMNARIAGLLETRKKEITNLRLREPLETLSREGSRRE